MDGQTDGHDLHIYATSRRIKTIPRKCLKHRSIIFYTYKLINTLSCRSDYQLITNESAIFSFYF